MNALAEKKGRLMQRNAKERCKTPETFGYPFGKPKIIYQT